MALGPNSLAAAVGSGIQNTPFAATATVIPRQILILATYDPLKTTVVNETPVQVFSAEDAGDKFGFGFMAHRLAVQAFEGSSGIPTFIQPQSEAVGAVAASGKITFTAAITVAGTMYLYIAGISVPVVIPQGIDGAAVAILVAAAITANSNLPITAVVNGVTLNQVDITAKSKGPWGNEITLRFNINGEKPLADLGITAAVIVDMASGAGIPTVADALNGLGTGDNANEAFFTDVVHGYGLDTTTLNAISAYVGSGDTFTGLYSKTVSRPFRVLTGDTVADTAGLTALIAITNNRLLDRANGVISVPGSASHPAEIAAQAIGHMARLNNIRAEQNYLGVSLNGIDPGATADRWTSDYDNRDTAVKKGISPTRVRSGAVYLQNVVTFYRPASIPVNSNAYRSMRNISIYQNILDNIRTNFESSKWQGISIVADVARVASTVDKQKARDIDSVVGDLIQLAGEFYSKGWIYTDSVTIDALTVAIRTGTDGFEMTFPIIPSGEGNIFDVTTLVDTSVAILNS